MSSLCTRRDRRRRIDAVSGPKDTRWSWLLLRLTPAAQLESKSPISSMCACDARMKISAIRPVARTRSIDLAYMSIDQSEKSSSGLSLAIRLRSGSSEPGGNWSISTVRSSKAGVAAPACPRPHGGMLGKRSFWRFIAASRNSTRSDLRQHFEVGCGRLRETRSRSGCGVEGPNRQAGARPWHAWQTFRTLGKTLQATNRLRLPTNRPRFCVGPSIEIPADRRTADLGRLLEHRGTRPNREGRRSGTRSGPHRRPAGQEPPPAALAPTARRRLSHPSPGTAVPGLPTRDVDLRSHLVPLLTGFRLAVLLSNRPGAQLQPRRQLSLCLLWRTWSRWTA